MRVGLVCPYDLGPPGGVQAQVEGLRTHLVEAGHEVEMVAPGVADLDLGRTNRVRANRSVAPLALNPRAGGVVRRQLEHCDVVHVHEPLMPVVSWAALGSGKPTVATFHADPPPLIRRLYRAMAPIGRSRLRSASVTAVSEVAAAGPRLLGIEPTIIPNGVAVPSRVKDHQDRRGVLFIGRDEPRKGLPVLLEAWDRARARSPDSDLSLIGVTGVDRPGVRFLGRVDDREKSRLLGLAAVLVAPNLGGESFGIVVAEGMAAGCAVLCSDLPAFRDVGGDGARYFATGDSQELAQRLTGLLTDQAARREVALAGRRRARVFAWEEVVSAYLSVYRRAITA